MCSVPGYKHADICCKVEHFIMGHDKYWLLESFSSGHLSNYIFLHFCVDL